MSLAALGRIAFNKEASWGNPGASWELLPVNPPTFSTTFENILDQGLRGLAVKDFDAYQGSEASEASLEGLAYPEQIGYLFEAILGTPTSAGSVHTFDFNVNGIVPSFAFEDYLAIGSPGVTPLGSAMQYTGMLCTNLTVKFNSAEGAMSWTASFIGRGGTMAPKTNVAGNGTVTPPFLGWEGSVKTGAGLYSKLTDYEVSFAREGVVEHVATNTQQPTYGYVGPLETTMKATIDFMNEEDFALYRNATKQELGVYFAKGAKTLSIVAPKVSWLEGPVEVDRGAANVKASWNLRALYNAGTANSPVRVILVNGTASY